MAKQTAPGPGVDASGQSVVDPTENVIRELRAAEKRADDLRELDRQHQLEIRRLEREHAKDLREGEAKRIDAIRQVDVQQTIRTADVQAQQAQALATQVTVQADVLRTLVATTAAAQQTSLAALLAPIQASLAEVQRAQYQTQGEKSQVVESRASTAERRDGNGLWIAALGLGISFVLALIFIGGLLIAKG